MQSKPAEEISSPEQHRAGILPYIHVLRKRKWVLLGALAFTLSIAFFINFTQKPVYKASAELVLETRQSQNSTQNQTASVLTNDPTFFLTQFRMIKSPAFAEKVLAKFNNPQDRKPLLKTFAVRSSGEPEGASIFSEKEKVSLGRAIRGALSPSQVQSGARLMLISVTGYHPAMVKRIADMAAQSYIEMNYESQIEAFKQSFSIVSRSLTEFREKIKTGEIAVQKIDSEIQLLEALKVYGERHPSVIQLRGDITVLSDKIDKGIQNFLELEIGQREGLLPLLQQPHLDIESLTAIETDLYNLKPILEREVSTTREMYDSVYRKLQEVEMLGGGRVWLDAKVIEPAAMPGRPIRPNKGMNVLLALIVGVFIGIGLAFFLEYLDSSIRSLDDIRSYLKLFPLGMVPQVDFDEGEEDSRTDSHRPYWLASDKGIPLYIAEAYRIIRTSLSFGSVDSSVKVMQVTSAIKGEGKTTTAANLGVSLAQAGVKTLLVDADMRRPSLHHILGLVGVKSGLSHALTHGASWESVVEPTAVPNLFCIPAGVIPPNPAELLSSERTQALIEELKANFDIILLDSPPTISVSDASIIASRVDGTILVTRAGYIPRHLCLQAKNTLEAVSGNVIGCVLNSIESHHQPYYYHRYYNYADYYGETEKQGKKKKRKRHSGDQLTVLDKLQALKDPLFALLLDGWDRLVRLIKGERPGGESKRPNGSPW